MMFGINKFQDNNIVSPQKYRNFMIPCRLMWPISHFSGDDTYGTWCNDEVGAKIRNCRNRIFTVDRYRVILSLEVPNYCL